MLIIRNTFTAIPGQAGKLAAHMKEMAAAGNLRNPRVLTDVIGNFNHVVMEHEVESLAEFEELSKRYMSDPAIREKAQAYLGSWTTGKREILRVV
jgi:hypothetical protein